jgi:gamma-glutamyltranspeptidase/glutathione hydrolase
MALGIPSYRPSVTGTTHMVSSGHYLASAAGYRILEEGGNAIDAGVASGLALNVLYPHWTSFGGVAPILIHDSRNNETVEIDGLGRWPRRATLEYFNSQIGGDIPIGILRCVTPAAADAWFTALKQYGSLSFEEVVAPALELADKGMPVPLSLHNALLTGAQRSQPGGLSDEILWTSWPSTTDIFIPKGQVLQTGDILIQKALANSFRRLIDVEKAHASVGREAALQAARDFFYQGDIAREMVKFSQENGGLLELEDLAKYHVSIGPPAKGRYKDVDIYTCGFWSQGPVVIQTLQILESFDLHTMTHNGANYIHTLIEALKLAFADRHAFFGDPDYVRVPSDGLLSPDYGHDRANQIDHKIASTKMPQPGNPWAFQNISGISQDTPHPRPHSQGGLQTDTSYTCVVDRWGNAFSATPSDGFTGSPVVPELGFIISSRGSQTWLDPKHPCALAPGKRPRLTPNPAIAFKDGRPWLPFGTPGGDMQTQAMVQLILNIVDFGMDPQQAIEAPRVSTWSFPGSFWPHAYLPGLVGVEGRIDSSVVKELGKRGHSVEVWDDWSGRVSDLCAIEIDSHRGILKAGADIRRESYAVGR